MTEQLVTVATFTTLQEASLAKADLEARGIPVFMADEFAIGGNPLYSNALGGIKVQVPASFLDEAHAVVTDAQQSGAQILGEEEPFAIENTRKKRIWVKCFIWLWLALIGAGLMVSFFNIFVYGGPSRNSVETLTLW